MSHEEARLRHGWIIAPMTPVDQARCRHWPTPGLAPKRLGHSCPCGQSIGSARTPTLAEVERFSKPDFWIWMGIIFGVNAAAAGVLGAGVLAVVAAVTGFSALLTAALMGRNAVGR